ncbi:MAG: TraB/GumN family protein [Verrucomicrobiae bacterium]|nr:TraB/GumN family protein [Verrucomicrobiae bacterium]NNJ42930.1 hypothetical protein [Akkermansiaceae bacterium]
MKTILLLFFSFCLFSASAQVVDSTATQVAEPSAPKRMASSFIRVKRDTENVKLQTGITRYVKGEVTVDLIGAIHIADAQYYTQLNQKFKAYESVLFEMVGGDQMKKGRLPEPAQEGDETMVKAINDLYGLLSQALRLQGQKEGINYQSANFVHADLSLKEFKNLQAQKGESLLGFALQSAAKGADSKIKPPNLQKLLMAMLSGNSNGMKRELVDTLGGADDQVSGMLGESVIIGDRNTKCLKVLDGQIKAGKKKLAIFYGAAHFPDMEKKMMKAGYQKTTHHWLTAWNIPSDRHRDDAE